MLALSSAFILVASFRKSAEMSLGAWDTFLVFCFHFNKGYIETEAFAIHTLQALTFHTFKQETSSESCNCVLA